MTGPYRGTIGQHIEAMKLSDHVDTIGEDEQENKGKYTYIKRTRVFIEALFTVV